MRKIFQRVKDLVTGAPTRGLKRPALNQTAVPHKAPEYLRCLVKKGLPPEYPTPTELFDAVVRYLQPSNRLPLIPDELISGYATAKYFLLATEWELSKLDPAEWDCSQPMFVMRENEQVAWSSIAAILRNISHFPTEPPSDEQLKIAPNMRVPATAET